VSRIAILLIFSHSTDTTVGSIGVSMGQHPGGMLSTPRRVPHQIEAVLRAKGLQLNISTVFLMFCTLNVITYYILHPEWDPITYIVHHF
jgi:hypothetical protein